MIDVDDKRRLRSITQQAGDWRRDMEREIAALEVNTDHSAKTYRTAIELYFACVYKTSEARMECTADDIDLCASSRCRERRREAEDAEEAARLALGTLVTTTTTDPK